MAKADLTAQTLREFFDYDPETGVFTRLMSAGTRGIVGGLAGSKCKAGYLLIGILGARYYAHRLAWLYMTSEWPSNHIDHIDGNPGNNAFCNLRDVPRNINMQNLRRAMVTSSSGLIGAAVDRKNGGYQPGIRVDGKRVSLGHFSTAEEAHASYIEAKRRLHPGCTI